MMQFLIEMAARYPNWAATAFGIGGLAVLNFFGWLLKRPLQAQAVKNEQFKTTVDGYESLIKSQAARIEYLESQDGLHVEYQALLIRRLRECEERNLLIRGSL